MKSIKLRLVIAATLLAVMAITFSAFAFGDGVGSTSVPLAGNVDNAAASVTPYIVAFASTHIWLATVLVVMGVARLVFKPLIAVVEAFVKSSPSASDDAFLAKCESSAIYRWFWFALDWLGSIKPPSASSTNPAITKQG